MVVRHLMCNNKACGNPAHLLVGDRQENNEDEYFIHGHPMAFGPGYETGGEPGKR